LIRAFIAFINMT